MYIHLFSVCLYSKLINMKKIVVTLTLAVTLTAMYSFVSINQMPQEVYTVNASSSVVGWNGSVNDHSHTGTITVKSGSVTAMDGKLNGGKFVLDMTSVKSNDGSGEKLDGHLKSDDFLAVAKFPEATFEITNVNYTNANNADITGTLNFKGISIPIKFSAIVRTLNEKKIFAEGFFSLDKNILGIAFAYAQNDIHFSVKITATK